MRNTFSLLLTLSILAALGTSSIAEPAKQPNVILVFIDDMGWADFSCFGNTDAQTVNIDQLATEGIAFEQFYVNSPICSPSRVAISTGQYPQRWKITSYLAHRAMNKARGMEQWLDPSAPMLARSLKQAGYATGHFGKWHMGGQRDVDEAPAITQYGFDQSLTNFEGMGPKLLPLTMKPGDKEPGRIWADAERLGDGFIWMQRSKITGGFVDAAIPFMDKAQKEGKPFYVNLWPDDMHGPLWPPVDKWADGKRGLYLSVLEEMDRQLGKLFDYVKQNEELRENTLILICSDNGHEPGAGRAGPLKGSKTNLYEGGIRSSLVAWGPGLMNKSSQGTRNQDSIFSAIDLVPSLLNITGATPPENVQYDGENLSDVLLGNSKDSRNQPIFFRRPPDRKSFYEFNELPDMAMRKGDWKLLCDYDGSRPVLYNLSKDISETTNLADKQPERTAEMVAELVAWNKTMPKDNGATYQPVKRKKKKAN